MDLGLIRKVNLDDEMQQSYLDYAMSVIVSRALPDARDGLKPVQRRILYAMYDMGLRPDSSYKKSARIVGEVLGKYHPHGDMAVYESMARLAQDFSMRYPLVDGQGNFGSVDGDPPAAMRYTEARLASPAMEMLNQIEKNTIDFSQNFDQSLQEPVVLPAAIPNLLVNGATGIAVGMATNIPPHNLGEVVDALVYMIQNWEKLDDLTVEDLLKFIQGPDFPTGGVIIQEAGSEGLMSAYGSGRGRVIVQARAHLEEMVRGRNRIIVTELPYQVNKASLIERIADLVREGTLEGLADLRDESDRQGMRIVIELSKTADPEKILRDLYKHTPMQTTFGIIMLALVDGEPRLLSIKQALRVYLDHRLVVVRRRSEFELARAKQRAHILEGLLVALKNLDEVINLIRNAPDAEQARLRLIKRFNLSENQAQAILDMQLRRLASLERKKIELEYKEVTALIKDLESLLKSPKRIRQVVADELQAMKQTYGDRRRTLILRLKEGTLASSLLTTTDVTPEQEVWLAVTPDGRISRTHDENMLPYDQGQAPRWLLKSNTHATLYLVTRQGKAAAIPVHAVPETTSVVEGIPVSKVSPLPEEESLAGVFTTPSHPTDGQVPYVLTATRLGLIKKTSAEELPGPSAHTFVIAKVNDGDELVDVALTLGQADLFLATAKGMGIRFKDTEVRPMGMVAAGVNGIKLSSGDELVAMQPLLETREIFFLAENGKAKRVKIEEFPVQGRYGQGVSAWKLPQNLHLVAAVASSGDARALIQTDQIIAASLSLSEAHLSTRVGQGGILPELKNVGQVRGVTLLEALRPPSPVEAKRAPHKKPIGEQPVMKNAIGRASKKEAAPDASKMVKSRSASPATGDAPGKAAQSRGAGQKPAGTRGKSAKASQPELLPLEPGVDGRAKAKPKRSTIGKVDKPATEVSGGKGTEKPTLRQTPPAHQPKPRAVEQKPVRSTPSRAKPPQSKTKAGKKPAAQKSQSPKTTTKKAPDTKEKLPTSGSTTPSKPTRPRKSDTAKGKQTPPTGKGSPK